MPDPMRIRAVEKDGSVNVKVLISHEMESGQRKDSAGNIIPPHYITNVKATCQGKEVMTAQWGTSVSKNPFVEFTFKGGKKGDKIQVNWVDNKGETRSDESTVV